MTAVRVLLCIAGPALLLGLALAWPRRVRGSLRGIPVTYPQALAPVTGGLLVVLALLLGGIAGALALWGSP